MLVVKYFSKYELTAPSTAIPATAATAKFRMAIGWEPDKEATASSSHPGSFFDCRTLSTTTLIGHGSRTSASVSPSTATKASVRARQWRRRKCATRAFLTRPGAMAVTGFGAAAPRSRGLDTPPVPDEAVAPVHPL